MVLEFAYVLVIHSDTEPKKYVGHFKSCESALAYQMENYPTYDSTCLQEDYIFLPKNLRKKFVIYPSEIHSKD